MRFVLIDRLLELVPGVHAAARKTFSPEEEVFRDHFPGNPLVPGVLLLEAMAQTAGWLAVASTGGAKGAQLMMVREAKFRRPVRPGVEVHLSASLLSSRRHAVELDVAATAEGELVASARLVLHTFDLPAEDAGAEQFRAWARETFHAIGGDALLDQR